MNAKSLLTAALLTLSLGTGAVAMAAGGTGNDASRPPQTREHSPSMMGGGMMGSCPMMGGNMGMDPKTAMRMHGEMMKAMGDIMLKYSDQAGTSPSK
ncbi:MULTISPECIES: hypothetical protein [unclassified Caballeronia]|uniref:hypothetical protein n=1 Tax=unclassified Caballeronia TaxID=2646786 RepID=UPI00285B1298|nr:MULTISPECIES: hypothetical protein [unclassified Caballeronia]MDR5751329.1 hypothetical protein [Caballeronia sp. LZ024]MDR5844529.1 hypothetical protein [Caballeronia sp. LZ031]